jgi:acetyl-CoA carboxylase carboxyltransferase component
MGPEGAANIIFRKEIMSSDDPDGMRKQKVEEYKAKFANPYAAASRGYVDAVIEPSETRRFLMRSLAVSENKVIQVPEKKHGLPPF